MAAEIQPSAATTPHKRKSRPSSKKSHKKQKTYTKSTKPKPSLRQQKLFRKRRYDYNSESEEEQPDDDDASDSDDDQKEQKTEQTDAAAADVTKGSDDDEEDEEAGEEKHQAVTKLGEGSKGFRIAFEKIMGKKIPDEHLGPVLSAHKSLIAEKLAEEVTDHKAKTETKKLKLLAQEKGHVVPDRLLGAKEKHLISVATKGVVKLFNAVSKAQTAQKGAGSSKTKDIRALTKRKKQTFLSELKKPTGAGDTSSKDNEEPGWAPLRDSYMLTNSKLKNWDKMTDAGGDDHGKVPMGSSSDDDE